MWSASSSNKLLPVRECHEYNNNVSFFIDGNDNTMMSYLDNDPLMIMSRT